MYNRRSSTSTSDLIIPYGTTRAAVATGAWVKSKHNVYLIRGSVGAYTDDNGNAMFQSYLSKLFNRLKIRSYRRYGEHGKKVFVFQGLFVHAAVRGGTCAFTFKIVNTLVKNSSRDDRPSIST